LTRNASLRRRLERLELIVSLIDGRVEAIDNCLDDQREAIGDLQMFACRDQG